MSLVLLPLLSGALLAQTAPFQAPQPILSDGPGWNRVIYPSPTIFDIDRDGAEELVVGDLWGKVWVSERAEGGATWGPRQELQATDGKPLRLNNW